MPWSLPTSDPQSTTTCAPSGLTNLHVQEGSQEEQWNCPNFPPGVSLTHVVFHSMLHRQIKVPSVRIGLSQKPGLAEPGCELGQMLCTGHTYLAKLGASDGSIRGLLLLLFVPSLQFLFEGWWKNIEYGWFSLEGSIATHRSKYCCQKHAVSLGERWASCRGQEADLGIGDESRTKQGITYKVGLKTRKCFLYCKIHQVGSRYLKRGIKRSLIGLQNTWPEQEIRWLNERFIGTLGFLMCISKVHTKLWHIIVYRHGWS